MIYLEEEKKEWWKDIEKGNETVKYKLNRPREKKREKIEKWE